MSDEHSPGFWKFQYEHARSREAYAVDERDEALAALRELRVAARQLRDDARRGISIRRPYAEAAIANADRVLGESENE